jgi:hypothetical protein
MSWKNAKSSTNSPSGSKSRGVDAGLEAALTAQAGSLAAVLCSAREVVLFGSRAAGCADPSSDWDLLLVDAVNVPRLRGFDLVPVSSHRSTSGPAWHASELATHVARYGLWLKGEPPARWHFDFEGAAARKRHILGIRLRALRPGWPRLSVPRKRKQFAILRRDLQRLALLECRQPIPPRQALDEAWRQIESREGWIGLLPAAEAELLSDWWWEIDDRRLA